MSTRAACVLLAWSVVAAAAAPGVARAFANVAVGQPIADAELRGLDGRKHALLGAGAKASVVVFFRPEQERSVDTLRGMADCEKEFAGKPVHWVAVVSSAWTEAEIRAVVTETGVTMPILVDQDDALYGRLGVRLHPAIGIFDGQRRLAAYEPFRQINYCDRIRARIRFLLGEMTAAEVAKVDDPDRAVTRTDEGVARRHLNYARNLARLERFGRALDEVQKSLAVIPTAEAYAMQGEILAAQGKCPDALRAFEVSLKMQPGNAVATEGRKRCLR